MSNKGKGTPTTIYDPYGNKMNGYVNNGVSYLSDGSRPPTGYTVQTGGGLYTMGADGKGTKVDSVPRKEYNPKPTKSPQNTGDNRINDLLGSLMGGVKQGPNYQDIMDQIMGNMPKYEMPPTMTQEEGRKLAEEEINPIFEKGLSDSMEQVDRNALRSGFFGQLPTVDRKGKIAGDLELEKTSALSRLANQLVGQSKEDGYRQAEFSRQQQMDSMNTLMSALQMAEMGQQNKNQQMSNLIGILTGMSNDKFTKGFEMMKFQDGKGFRDKQYDDSTSFRDKQYSDSRDDAKWQKGVTEAQITGIFKGEPTMAFTQLTHSMGMDTRKIEAMEKELNHNIEMSWEQLKDNRTAMANAERRANAKSSGSSGPSLSYMKYMTSTKETAYKMAREHFEGKTKDDGSLKWMLPGIGSESQTKKNNYTDDDFYSQVDTYTRMLLGQDFGTNDYGWYDE